MSQEVIQKKNPEEIVTVLNDICNAAMITNSIKPTFTPRKEQIYTQIVDKKGDTLLAISEPKIFLETFNAQENSSVVLFITGWKSSNISKVLKDAYQCRGNVTLMIIDLSDKIDNLQTWLSVDHDQIGEWVSEVLAEIVKKISVSRIHLIGHGIGAHIAGAASRTFTEITGTTLPRITGLDPALLCYKESQTISGLQKGDASTVDVIHSSAYGLGKREPLGDIDFFPNGPSILQPGCTNLVCAHNRAIEYFVESIVPGNEENFIGQKCNSIKNIQSNKCQQKSIIMGMAMPANSKGNYFLQTRSTYPYGNNVSLDVQRKNAQC